MTLVLRMRQSVEQFEEVLIAGKDRRSDIRHEEAIGIFYFIPIYFFNSKSHYEYLTTFIRHPCSVRPRTERVCDKLYFIIVFDGINIHKLCTNNSLIDDRLISGPKAGRKLNIFLC